MISYLMLGTNDLEGAADFYDSLFKEIGATRAYDTEKLVAWNFGEGTPLFSITKPFDKNPRNGRKWGYGCVESRKC